MEHDHGWTGKASLSVVGQVSSRSKGKSEENTTRWFDGGRELHSRRVRGNIMDKVYCVLRDVVALLVKACDFYYPLTWAPKWVGLPRDILPLW